MADVDHRSAGSKGDSAHREPRMRASDAERHATVMALQDAMSRGLLAPDEAGERMGSAFAAVHVDELRALTDDLPAADPGDVRPLGWSGLATMAVEQLRFSLTNGGTGRLDPARVAALLLLMMLLAAVFGVVVASQFDAGYPPGPGGYGRH